MTHRLTKEELDEQFELFLKESVSDDSVDLCSSDKQPGAQSSQKSAQKPTVSWWQDDEHSVAGTGRVVSAEPFYKPVPKPRSSVLNKLVQLDKNLKGTVLKVSQTAERQRTPTDDSRSDSLSSPTHENLQCVSGERSPDESHYHDTPTASTGSPSQGDGEDGLAGSGKSFRKSLRKSLSIREEDEDPGRAGWKEKGPEAAALVRENTEIEVMVPAVNTTGIGLDTLEEEEEKARFFAQLEAAASSTIDYSNLNRDLDSTSSTIGTNLRNAEEAVEQRDDDKKKAKVTETVRESPAFTGSPHYSEDFEEEENGKDPVEEKSKMSPILAKVSLYDSLDDTSGEDKRKDTAGSLDRGQLYVQSGGSDMEALHEAYRQIHVVEDSDDHNHHYPSLEERGRINRVASPSSPQHAGQSLEPASTNQSELPTAEELMRPIRPEMDHIRGFTLQPVRF